MYCSSDTVVGMPGEDLYVNRQVIPVSSRRSYSSAGVKVKIGQNNSKGVLSAAMFAPSGGETTFNHSPWVTMFFKISRPPFLCVWYPKSQAQN